MIYDEDDWITLNEAAQINGITLSGACRRHRAGTYGESIRGTMNRNLVRRETVTAAGRSNRGQHLGALTALQFDVLDLLAVTGSVSTSELHRRVLTSCSTYDTARRRLSHWTETSLPSQQMIEIAYYCAPPAGDSVDPSRGVTLHPNKRVKYEPVWRITDYGRQVLAQEYDHLEASASVENDSQLLDDARTPT